MLEKIIETTEFLRAKGIIDPDAGIILGTGLGELTAKINNRIEIDYKDIPNFPLSTVEGHAGKLIFGEFGRKKIVAMKGRFHYYEGYGAEQVALPVRVLKYLGIKCLFLSNAAGGVNPSFQIGDIMIITEKNRIWLTRFFVFFILKIIIFRSFTTFYLRSCIVAFSSTIF